MISFKKDCYILAIWFIDLGEEADWMASVIRDPGENWKIVYRLRKIRDTKIWGSDDEKSWGSAEVDAKAPEEEILKAVNELARQVAEKLDGVYDRLIVRGGPDKLYEKAKQKPWMHLKEEPIH